MATQRPLPLPREWPQVIQSGVLHALSLASAALATAWARASRTRRLRVAEVDRLRAEIALLREELDIKDERCQIVGSQEASLSWRPCGSARCVRSLAVT